MPEERVVLVTGSSRGDRGHTGDRVRQGRIPVVLNYAHSQGKPRPCIGCWWDQHGADRILLRKANVAKRDEVKPCSMRPWIDSERVDVLVNNAGLNIDGPFLAMTRT